MPDEKEIANLLATLKDTSQPDEIRREAMQRLLAHEEEVQSHLRKDFKANVPDPEVMHSEAGRAYDRLRQQLNFANQGSRPVQTAPARIFHFRRLAGIAAAVLLFVAGAWFFRHHGNGPTIATIGEPPGVFTPNNRVDTIRNPGQSTAFHRLQDGSTVHLEAGSNIYFRDSFPTGKKEIFLQGSALFAVCRDAARPFSVFVSGIEVVDLGTVFSVTTNRSLVKVRLLQGKVLIHPVNPQLKMRDIRLEPGQELRIDTGTRQYSVNFMTSERMLRSSRLRKQLSFKNTSLQEVLDRLEEECSVTIYFNRSEIRDMAFTGTFDTGSNPRDIIATICMINNLKYELRSNTIYIHK